MPHGQRAQATLRAMRRRYLRLRVPQALTQSHVRVGEDDKMERTAEEQAELEVLVRAQQREDRQGTYQEPEIIGYHRTVSMSSVDFTAADDEDEPPWAADATLDPAFIYERDNEPDEGEGYNAVEAVVADLPRDQAEVYQLIYRERLSLREAAARMDVGLQVVRTLEGKVRAAVFAATRHAYGE